MRTYLIYIAVVLLCALTGEQASAQTSSKNAEARVYFEEGNRLYAEAADASDAKRRRLLQQALEAYVDSLGVVRSRNALYNAAVVLEELDRGAESFNYYTEYLAIGDLTDSDRKQATERRDALRPTVALLHVESTPPGAEVWVDRKDLASLGLTPIEVAVAPGTHSLFMEKDGFFDETQAAQTAIGKSVSVAITLRPVTVPPLEAPPPVDLAPPEPELRLRNAAIGTAAGAVAVAAVGLGVSLRARTLRNDYNAAAERYQMTGDPADLAQAERLADRTDRFNIAADVMWGTAGALGVSAIVLYAVHRRRLRQDRIHVDVTAHKRGAFASVRWSLGGRP